MKIVFVVSIMLLSISSFSQPVFTLVAKSYSILNGSKQTKVNKSMILTYNENYSWLYIQDEKNQSFPNEAYTKDLIDGYLHESYLSGATDLTLRGHYSVHIFHEKDNNIFEIASFVTGTTFYAEHAVLFSENGKVMHNPYVTNWKELLEKEEQRKSKEELLKSLEKTKNKLINDSLRKVEVKDSIRLIRLDSMKRVEAENKLLSGDTYISIDRSIDFTLNSIVQKKVNLKNDEFIIYSWKIIIDKEGVITDALPDENNKGGHLISSYIPAINNALINQRIKPFVAQNGNNYPFYSTVDICLKSFAETGKKRLKLKDALKMLPLGF
ncbi:MAG: hypothetical protein NTY07_02270 [Bacteroidia bacterium]|nr:hypothetical protein [Bacteroidia bacterium]